MADEYHTDQQSKTVHIRGSLSEKTDKHTVVRSGHYLFEIPSQDIVESETIGDELVLAVARDSKILLRTIIDSSQVASVASGRGSIAFVNHQDDCTDCSRCTDCTDCSRCTDCTDCSRCTDSLPVALGTGITAKARFLTRQNVGTSRLPERRD